MLLPMIKIVHQEEYDSGADSSNNVIGVINMVNEVGTKFYGYDSHIYHNYQRAISSVEEDIKRPMSIIEESAIEKNFKAALEQHRSSRFQSILKQRILSEIPEIEGIQDSDSTYTNVTDRYNPTTPPEASPIVQPILSNIYSINLDSPQTQKYPASNESSYVSEHFTPPQRLTMPPVNLIQRPSKAILEATLIDTIYTAVETRVYPSPVKEYPCHWMYKTAISVKNALLSLLAVTTKTCHRLRTFVTKTMDPEYYGTEPLPCNCNIRHHDKKITRSRRILDWVEAKSNELHRRAHAEAGTWSKYRSEIDKYHGKILYGPKVNKKRGMKRKVPYS